MFKIILFIYFGFNVISPFCQTILFFALNLDIKQYNLAGLHVHSIFVLLVVLACRHFFV